MSPVVAMVPEHVEGEVSELPSRLHPKLVARLREHNLFGALTEVNSPRFFKFVMQPKQILRNGWLLDPDLELTQSQVRAYVLRPALGHDGPAPVWQRLVIDRAGRVAYLTTISGELQQVVSVSLETMQVLDNQVTAPVSLN